MDQSKKRRVAASDATDLNEYPPEELRFEDDRPPPRAGDPLPRATAARELTPRRVREAGLTGGSAGHATADDASPETLLDEDHGRAADQKLRRVDGSEIGGGFGKDEAELAREKPDRGRARGDGSPSRGPGRMHSRNRPSQHSHREH